MVEKKPQTWSETLLEIVVRFILGALLGGFIALMILLAGGRFYHPQQDAFWALYVKYLWWGIPVGFGILGIFHVDDMLDNACKYFDGVSRRNY